MNVKTSADAPLPREERADEVAQAEKQRRWLDENRAAFDSVNDFVVKHGVFNEDERGW